MNRAKVIGVFGLSGVGKTSLIRNAVADHDGILHLQASTLIKQARAGRLKII
jgi:molybdopterin-guanine dinucleotide biosynthesis protein